MFTFENDSTLIDDREDLIAVIRMRFGKISGEMIESIYEINDGNTLQRLILAAANASSWNVFVEEWKAKESSFRLVGEEFNPLRDILKERDQASGA